MAAPADPVLVRIGSRGRKGSGGQVDPEARRPGKLVQQRDQDAARSGAEIDDSQGRLPVREEIEHRLDDGLRVGPGHQGLGGEAEGQAPELPDPDDPGHRLMGEAPAGEGGEGLALPGGQGRIRMRDEGCCRDAQRRQKIATALNGVADAFSIRFGATEMKNSHRFREAASRAASSK